MSKLQPPVAPASPGGSDKSLPFVDWDTATPESQGMNAAQLAALWTDLRGRQTTAFLVIRNDAVVFERYTGSDSRTTKHGTASLAKALVGGMALMTALNDRRIGPDDPVSRYVPQWRADPRKRTITVRQLATHTSGLEDAEVEDTAGNDLPHERLTGWKGDFWKGLDPPRDPFTLARDVVPVLDRPGAGERYSNPGMAMLAYCVTASLQGAGKHESGSERDTDLRSLLRHRLMEPLGVPASEWTCGYGKTVRVEGLPLVPVWGGAAYSPNAAARVGRLLLRRGDWNGQRLLDAAVVQSATTNADVPNPSGLGWWVNDAPGGRKRWPTAPDDAFSGAGAGHQFLLVIPSLNLIVVRYGRALDPTAEFNAALDHFLVRPLMQSLTSRRH